MSFRFHSITLNFLVGSEKSLAAVEEFARRLYEKNLALVDKSSKFTTFQDLLPEEPYRVEERPEFDDEENPED